MTRKTISQRIALEGGEAIKDDLQKLGKAGEQAFEQIRDAANIKGGFGADFGRAMQNIRAQIDKVRPQIAKLRDDFRALGGAMGTVAGRVTAAGAAIGAAAGGTVLLVKGAADTAKEITRLSQVAGATPDVFQRWAAGAQSVGIEQEKMADILKDTNDKVGDFLVTGGGPLADFFEQIAPKVGLTADSFRNLSGPQALQLYVSALEKANLSQAQMTFYMEALASDSTLLLPLLRNGGAEMQRLGDRASDLGAILDTAAIAALKRADGALRDTGNAFAGLRAQIAAILAPSVAAGANQLSAWIADNQQAILAFTESLVQRAGPVIRDFMLALSGQDALVQNQWVIDLRDRIAAFAETVRSAVQDIILPAFDALVGVANSVAGAINGVFGTDFSGQELLIAGAILKITGLLNVLTISLGIVKTAISPLVALVPLLVSGLSSLAPIFATALGSITGFIARIAIGAASLVAGITGLPVLAVAAIAAAIAAVGTAVYVYWDEIKAAASAAWDWYVETWGNIGVWLGERFMEAAAAVADVWASIHAGATEAWDAYVEVWQDAGTWLAARFAEGVEAIGALWPQLTAGAGSAIDWLRDGFSALWDSITGGFDSVVNAADRAWSRIRSIASQIKSALSSALSADEGDTGAALPGYRAGGMIRGAGTGTSDSILARLSNGEFVVRAAAVRHYGPQILAALNAMRLPKFATGGLVSGIGQGLGAAMAMPDLRLPAMAMPAMASPGRPLSLTIGGETFDGLTVPDDQAERLMRYAARRHLASAGRKPGWVK